MYEAFYGFRARPFSVLPDAEFLYLSRGHKLALTLLEFGLGDQTGYTVITGEIGSGKTTIVAHLLEHMVAGHTIGYITNTAELNNDLMKWLLFAFDVPCDSDDGTVLYKAFTEFLKRQHGRGENCVLIIDEAQHLTSQTLERLRLLSNVNVGKVQLFQLILVGQPELLEQLQRPDMVQFSQRISANFHLEALSLLETREYIRTRLRSAGGVETLFDEAACDLVYIVARGIPRQINILCDTALIYGYAESQYHVDIDTVIAVLRDRATAQRLNAAPKLEELERPLLEAKIREAREREFSREAERGLALEAAPRASGNGVGSPAASENIAEDMPSLFDDPHSPLGGRGEWPGIGTGGNGNGSGLSGKSAAVTQASETILDRGAVGAPGDDARARLAATPEPGSTGTSSRQDASKPDQATRASTASNATGDVVAVNRAEPSTRSGNRRSSNKGKASKAAPRASADDASAHRTRAAARREAEMRSEAHGRPDPSLRPAASSSSNGTGQRTVRETGDARPHAQFPQPADRFVVQEMHEEATPRSQRRWGRFLVLGLIFVFVILVLLLVRYETVRSLLESA